MTDDPRNLAATADYEQKAAAFRQASADAEDVIDAAGAWRLLADARHTELLSVFADLASQLADQPLTPLMVQASIDGAALDRATATLNATAEQVRADLAVQAAPVMDGDPHAPDGPVDREVPW